MKANRDLIPVPGIRLSLTNPEVQLLMGALASINMHTTGDRFDFAAQLYTLLVKTLDLEKQCE